MSKGLETHVVFLVAAVIFIGVVLFIMFKIFPSVLTEIELYFGWIQPSDLEQAVLCSYYRCAQGCLSAEVQQITWKEGGKTISCNSFCQNLPDQAYQISCNCVGGKEAGGHCLGDCENSGTSCNSQSDCIPKISQSELKVCNSNYPVNITLDKSDVGKSGLLNKDHLADIAVTTPAPTTCIVYPGVDWTGLGSFGAEDSFVYVHRDQWTNIKDWYCIDQPFEHISAIESATIKPGTIYISTYRGCPQGLLTCSPLGGPLLTEITVK